MHTGIGIVVALIFAGGCASAPRGEFPGLEATPAVAPDSATPRFAQPKPKALAGLLELELQVTPTRVEIGRRRADVPARILGHLRNISNAPIAVLWPTHQRLFSGDLDRFAEFSLMGVTEDGGLHYPFMMREMPSVAGERREEHVVVLQPGGVFDLSPWLKFELSLWKRPAGRRERTRFRACYRVVREFGERPRPDAQESLAAPLAAAGEVWSNDVWIDR